MCQGVMGDLLFLPLVNETISGMEDAEIIDVLYVAFLELRIDTEFLPNKVQSV